MATSSSSSSSSISLLLIVLLHFCTHHTHSTTHPNDVQVLKQLKSTIKHATPKLTPGSCVDSWDFTLDPCENLFKEKFTCGFRCDAVSNSYSRVTELALDSAGYSGSINTVSWNKLPYLTNLDLSNNNFNGPVPASLSGLTRLNRLALSRNSLTDSVPDSLGSLSNLTELYLDGNSLRGGVPVSFNGLKNLKRLEIQGNKFTGEFPDLSRLTELSFLDASGNSISGELPANLPPALVELVMRENLLEGNIPAGVANSVFLQVMDLSHNRLTGSVPASLFTHPALQQLTLSFNRFGSIQVPVTLGLTSQLISIDLSNNDIRGLLPGFMGLMPRLSALSLENNKISGLIPTQYVLKVLVSGLGRDTAQFERLLLGGNYLFGPIPGPFMGLKAGSVTVRLGNNCLYRCPVRWFFCEGGVQKSLMECRAFGPIVP